MQSYSKELLSSILDDANQRVASEHKLLLLMFNAFSTFEISKNTFTHVFLAYEQCDLSNYRYLNQLVGLFIPKSNVFDEGDGEILLRVLYL